MSSTSSSSTSSAPRTASQSSQAADSQPDSQTGWSTRYIRVQPKTTLPWMLAYAAGGSLPGTIKKMTRDPREAPTGLRLGRRDWFFFGKETRLFWVSRRRVWEHSSRSLDDDAYEDQDQGEDEDGEGTVAMTPPDIPPLGLSEPFSFPMPRPNAHMAHEQPPTNTSMASRPRAYFPNGFAGHPSVTSYRGGFNSLPRNSPGIGFGMPSVGRRT